MENSKILAEAVLRVAYSGAERSSNAFNECRHCHNWIYHLQPFEEHDSECPVLLAKRVLEEI
jgi:hypothetical protein